MGAEGNVMASANVRAFFFFKYRGARWGQGSGKEKATDNRTCERKQKAEGGDG